MKAYMSDWETRRARPFDTGRGRIAAETEARAILAESERAEDGWTCHVPLSARGSIVVGGPWLPKAEAYRYNLTLPVGTEELAEALVPFVGDAQ
jgi:hypothetical protein